MPLVIALVLILAAFAVAAALVPFALIFRYYHGTRRRRARRWLARLNVGSLALSMTLFLITAAVTSRWVPQALAYSSLGLACGAVLGLLGLALTRWERAGRDLFYTPSRLLVLLISAVVASRIGYSLWRGWHTWRAGVGDDSLLTAIGVGGSMAAGAVVLGYYLVYWMGIASLLRRRTANAVSTSQ